MGTWNGAESLNSLEAGTGLMSLQPQHEGRACLLVGDLSKQVSSSLVQEHFAVLEGSPYQIMMSLRHCTLNNFSAKMKTMSESLSRI